MELNRFQRRAQAAIERKGTKGGVHQERSFQELVGQANRDALKPFILECVNELEPILRQEFSRLLIESLAPVQTRLMVLEKLAMEKWGVTEETLALRLLDVEDEATGHVMTLDPAEAGDLLRVTATLRVEGQEKWSKPMNLIIRRLAKPQLNPETGQLSFQTYPELEQALVGAKVGETRETPVEIVNGEVTVKYNFKVTVDRVSRNEEERAREAAFVKAQAEAAAKKAIEEGKSEKGVEGELTPSDGPVVEAPNG